MGAAPRRLLFGIALLLLSLPARADQTQGAPELDLYDTFDPVRRLFFTAIGYPDRTAVFEFGPSIDFLLKPIVRDAILGPNEARRRELTFRMGYHYLVVPPMMASAASPLMAREAAAVADSSHAFIQLE
jgi:hypothetical protein